MRLFSICITDEEIADLHRRLDNIRWPDQLNDADWSYGTDLEYLRDLCSYWRNEFDWRAQEKALNRFDQFLMEVDGQTLHFIHQRSRHENAKPIILTHGWPGSVVEFLKVIEPLTDPEAHGGTAEDAFHVVSASLPGFGFSPAATSSGMGPRRIAGMQAKLMAELGYDSYIAQGGDWGAMISTEMGRQDPQHCRGVHLNMVFASPPEGEDNPMDGVTEAEAQAMQQSEHFSKEGMGYFHIQSTKPQTLAYALNDSPVGLAGWIVEKFRAWSDCDGEVERSFTKDELLTNIALYWFTSTPGSSARIYYETMHSEQDTSRVEVPTGAVIFPAELIKAPRRWAESAYNIVHWSEMKKGGHFAAMEVPELFVQDVRAFAAILRKS